MAITDLWAVLLASTSLSLVLCLILTPLAQRLGWMDQPSKHKVHTTPVPLVGGVSIYLSMATIIMLTTHLDWEVLSLLIASGLLMVSGLVDDWRELSPLTRFVLQIAACGIMIFAGGVVLTDFGSLMWNGVLYLGWLSVPITIFASLGVINAFNMVDGVDGLSATIFMIACTAIAWLALQAGHVINAKLLGIAIGAVFGFFLLNARLPWNHCARVFLGDSGSVFLGLFLAWQLVDLGNGVDRAFEPMTAVWILGIPLLDTTRLMSRRWRSGVSAFAADQFHLHHAFLKAGFSVRQTWAAITMMALLTTLVGLAGQFMGWPEYWMFYGYILFSLAYVRMMHRCWRDGYFLGRRLSSDLN